MSGTGIYSRGWLALSSEPASGGYHRVLDVDELRAAAALRELDTVYLFDEQHTLAAMGEVTGGGVDGERVWRRRIDDVSYVFLDEDQAQQSGPWEGLAPAELLAAFRNLERLLGVPWADSVGRTAEALILATHPRARGGRVLDAEPVIPPPAEGNVELPWMNWTRPLTHEEQRTADDGGYVHTFDANAQYLGAWQTVELPHGTPTHHPTGKAFDPHVAGFWRIPAASLPSPDSQVPGLPTPWLDGREWFTTPTVLRMYELAAYAPKVAEAWTWPERSRFLRGAAERLRDARRDAMAASAEARRVWLDADLGEDNASIDRADQALLKMVTADAVLDAVKSIYRVETGRFNMAARSAKSGFHRPEWGHFVRAQARVNMHRKLSNLRAKPFAIATDAVAFIAAEQDARTFAEWLGLPVGIGLGQYKVQGSRPASITYLDASAARIFEQVAAR